MYGDPRLLILDEPNANLDEEGDAALAAALIALKARGVTVIVVTHRRNLTSRLDRIAILRNGKIEAFGHTASVLARLGESPKVLAFPGTDPHAGERMNAASDSPRCWMPPTPGPRAASIAAAVHPAAGRVSRVLLGIWSALAPISGAVIATARIKTELERKTVQHREGGIVREIKVRNGQKVRAGDVLVIMDDVRSDAELSLLEDQWRAERLRHARVSAESTLAREFTVDKNLRRPMRAWPSRWRASARSSTRAAPRAR